MLLESTKACSLVKEEQCETLENLARNLIGNVKTTSGFQQLKFQMLTNKIRQLKQLYFSFV